MPNTLKRNQRRFLVELDLRLAKKLDTHLRRSRGSDKSRAAVVRTAIEAYVANSYAAADDEVVLPHADRQALDVFCDEGDGAVPGKVVANALRIYLPFSRWKRDSEARPENVSPLVEHVVRPEVAHQVTRFCSRTRVHARWFLEDAIQQQVAAGERDQWQRFLFRAPSAVATQIASLTEKTGLDPNEVIVRALDLYIAGRLNNEPELKRRLELLSSERTAQLTLFQPLAEARP